MRNGVFGGRMLENVERCGGVPVVIDHEWGEPCDPNKLEATLEQHPDTRIVAFVHAETSTGALSDAKTLVEIAHKHGALTIVDAVTSLGGCPVLVDEWGIDAIYSASQKCLSCTPGLSPVSFSEGVVEYVKRRKDKIRLRVHARQGGAAEAEQGEAGGLNGERTLHSFRPVRGKLGWGFDGRRPVAQPLCRAERNCRARC